MVPTLKPPQAIPLYCDTFRFTVVNFQVISRKHRGTARLKATLKLQHVWISNMVLDFYHPEYTVLALYSNQCLFNVCLLEHDKIYLHKKH